MYELPYSARKKKIYQVTTTMEKHYNTCHYIYKTLIQLVVNVEVIFLPLPASTHNYDRTFQ